MLKVLTDQEVEEQNRRVELLHNSSDLKNRITGILIDTSIGKVGMHEPEARIKAEALAHLFNIWFQTKP